MKWIFSLVILVGACDLVAQIKPTPRERRINSLIEKRAPEMDTRREEALALLLKVQDGIVNVSIGALGNHFGNQVSMSISEFESGYFSSNHALSILQNYFGVRKVLSFSFSRMSDDTPNPYATGRLTSIYQGNKESAQIYVSLAKQDSRWVIKQFNIY